MRCGDFFFKSNDFCSEACGSTGISRRKVDVSEVLVSMPAVRVLNSSALSLCFGLAGRDHTFDGRAFKPTFSKSFGFRFAVNV